MSGEDEVRNGALEYVGVFGLKPERPRVAVADGQQELPYHEDVFASRSIAPREHPGQLMMYFVDERPAEGND